MKIVIMVMSVLAAVLIVFHPAFASVEISEILADPAKEMAGDANEDGVRSAAGDEFIEIHNASADAVNLSMWKIQDNKKVRHVFPEDSIIQPGQFIAVFGGSKENLRYPNWQKASTGSLGLDNDGDTVMLLDEKETIIDRIEYKNTGAKDQSLVVERKDGEKTVVLHSLLDDASGALFSPGKSVNEAVVKNVKK